MRSCDFSYLFISILFVFFWFWVSRANSLFPSKNLRHRRQRVNFGNMRPMQFLCMHARKCDFITKRKIFQFAFAAKNRHCINCMQQMALPSENDCNWVPNHAYTVIRLFVQLLLRAFIQTHRPASSVPSNSQVRVCSALRFHRNAFKILRGYIGVACRTPNTRTIQLHIYCLDFHWKYYYNFSEYIVRRTAYQIPAEKKQHQQQKKIWESCECSHVSPPYKSVEKHFRTCKNYDLCVVSQSQSFVTHCARQTLLATRTGCPRRIWLRHRAFNSPGKKNNKIIKHSNHNRSSHIHIFPIVLSAIFKAMGTSVSVRKAKKWRKRDNNCVRCYLCALCPLKLSTLSFGPCRPFQLSCKRWKNPQISTMGLNVWLLLALCKIQ